MDVLNSFVQSFISEIYSIVRAHVGALGGNALVSFFISDLVVMPSIHKNQVSTVSLALFRFYFGRYGSSGPAKPRTSLNRAFFGEHDGGDADCAHSLYRMVRLG